jgi:hypothetical protein
MTHVISSHLYLLMTLLEMALTWVVGREFMPHDGEEAQRQFVTMMRASISQARSVLPNQLIDGRVWIAFASKHHEPGNVVAQQLAELQKKFPGSNVLRIRFVAGEVPRTHWSSTQKMKYHRLLGRSFASVTMRTLAERYPAEEFNLNVFHTPKENLTAVVSRVRHADVDVLIAAWRSYDDVVNTTL